MSFFAIFTVILGQKSIFIGMSFEVILGFFEKAKYALYIRAYASIKNNFSSPLLSINCIIHYSKCKHLMKN